MRGRLLANPLVGRLAQASGRHPFAVVVALSDRKRRRALLRKEATRQDELSRLVREKLLKAGELWVPESGTRLAREWEDVKCQLVRQGVIDAL